MRSAVHCQQWLYFFALTAQSMQRHLQRRFYDSLRQSNQRIVKKISNKDFSLKEHTGEYAHARGERLNAFIEQQRAQQNGPSDQLQSSPSRDTISGTGTSTSSGSVLRISDVDGELGRNDNAIAADVQSADAAPATTRRRQRFVLPM